MAKHRRPKLAHDRLLVVALLILAMRGESRAASVAMLLITAYVVADHWRCR